MGVWQRKGVGGMSKAWRGGSTRAWRKLRAQVLLNNRVTNAGRCQLALPGICTGETDGHTLKAEQQRGTTRATSWPLAQLAISQSVNHKQASNHDQSQSGEHSEQQKSRPPAGFFPLGGRRT